MTVMPVPSLRLVNGDGSLGKALTGWTSVSIGGDDGEPLVLDLQVPTDSAGYAELDEQVEVALLLDNIEPPDCRFVLDEVADDEIAGDESGTWKGSSQLFQFHYARVYPSSYPSLAVQGVQLAAATPGYALRLLVEAAQARGWWPELTLSFTDTHDSGGQAWSTTLNDFLDMGRTYLDVVTQWSQRRLAVARVVGADTLALYQYGNQGEDLEDEVHLLPDRHLSEGPSARSWRDTVSAMLAVTDTDGVSAITRTDAAALSKYGRREGYLSQSQVVNVSTLESIADATIAVSATSRDSFTYGLADTQKHLPFIDYDRGDVLTVRTRAGDRVMRLRQLTVTWDADGGWSGSAAFGSKLKTPEEALQERLDQLTSGSMDRGLYQTPVLSGQGVYVGGGGGGEDPPARDTVPPKPPTALDVTNVQYTFVNGGFLGAIATVEWTAPNQNADDTPLLDLSHYEIQFKEQTATIWEPSGTVSAGTEDTTLQLVPNEQYDVRVRAVDVWLNRSSWATHSFVTLADSVPPAQPSSTPIVTPVLFSALKVGWDGEDSSGNAFEQDVWYAEVHLSTTSGFTPSAGTYVARLERPTQGLSETVLTDLQANTTYYVKLRAVDAWGNVGPASAQASGVPVDVFSDVASEFADFGNLVPDGSFERPETRSGLLASADLRQSADGVTWSTGGSWSFTENTGQHILLEVDSTSTGQWVARHSTTAPTGVDADGVYKDGGSMSRWSSSADIAFDSSKLYRGSIRVRVSRNATNSPPKQVFGAFEAKNSGGTLLNPNTGATTTNYGDVRYELANDLNQVLADGWRTWEGWVSGTMAAPVGGGSGTQVDPYKLVSGTTRFGLQVILDEPDGNGKWHVGVAQITGVPVSWHGQWALQVDGSATAYRRAVVARLDAQGGAEQWYLRFRCRLTGPSSPVPVVSGGVRLVGADGSEIPTTAGPSISSFVKDGWMTVEGRVARDPAARWAVAATAELFVQVQGMAAGQTMAFDAVEFRQVATNVLIADAAIDNAKIVSLSASKITAGTLSATVTLTGELRTADTGARSVINSSGVKLYNAAGDNTVSLNAADGSASFSGTIGSVDIVGYARVINPVTLAQMFMHPGAGQYPGLYASVGYAAERGAGGLSLNGGQLLKDMIWFLETPRVSFQNTPDPNTAYEVSRFSLGILTNAMLTSSDPSLWPTRIGGYARITVPYVTGSSPNGWTVTTRPFFEFQHDLHPTAIDAPMATTIDNGAQTGIWWANKYGHSVGMRMLPTGSAASNVRMDFFKNKSEWLDLFALSFQAQSSSELKDRIVEPGISAVDVVLANPAREWSFKGQDQRRIGPMADNLPPMVSPDGKSVDTTSMIGLLWKAVEELVKEVRGG